MRLLLVIGFIAFNTAAARGQDTAAAPRLNVYLDCQTSYCDFDFFRTELTLVNWVRDRQVADVHLLVTTQTTCAGGSEFTVNFIGLRQFTGMADTLRYVSPPAATDDERRRGLGRVFRLGLAAKRRERLIGLIPYRADIPPNERVITLAAGTPT